MDIRLQVLQAGLLRQRQRALQRLQGYLKIIIIHNQAQCQVCLRLQIFRRT